MFDKFLGDPFEVSLKAKSELFGEKKAENRAIFRVSSGLWPQRVYLRGIFHYTLHGGLLPLFEFYEHFDIWKGPRRVLGPVMTLW